jgi:hypothetical protein
MTNTLRIAAACIAVLMLTSTAEARHRHHHHRAVSDANGNISSPGVVKSKKTGATAVVGAAYAGAFQAYIDDLEASGASVRFMGGVRRGHCGLASMHPCGKALDVCQLSRGRVDARCNLPSRRAIASIAERHGLFEGGRWCNSDYGHAQVGESAAACGSRTFAARSRHRRVADANPQFNNQASLPNTPMWGRN